MLENFLLYGILICFAVLAIPKKKRSTKVTMIKAWGKLKDPRFYIEIMD